MCEDADRFNDQLRARVTTKDSGDYITQLRNMSEGSAATMKELHTREEEFREALGLAHAEESKLYLLGVALQQKVATLTREKQEKKELTSSFKVLKKKDVAKKDVLEVVRRELGQAKAKLEASNIGQSSGMQV